VNGIDRDITLSTSIRVGIVLLPVALALLAAALSPRFFDPMFTGQPSLLGIALTDLVTAGAVGWGFLGGFLVARSRKPWAFPVGLLVFTLPASFVIILGPALILILQNLG